MSDTTIATAPSKNTLSQKARDSIAALPPFSVERNGVNLTFEPVLVKRGDDKDTVYPFPSITKDNFGTVQQFLGDDFIIKLVKKGLQLMYQNYYGQASTGRDDKPQPFDQEEFIGYVKSQTVAGESKADLEARQEELTDRIVEIMSDENTYSDEDQAAIDKEQKEIAAEMKALKVALANRKRGPREPKPAVAPQPAVA